MKRCPIEQGGCGGLVDLLFDSGVCQNCDAAIERGTAAAGGKPRGRIIRNNAIDPDAEPDPNSGAKNSAEPCRKYVKSPERGICAKCLGTRASHLAKKNGAPKKREPRPPAEPDDDSLMIIERLRSTYTDEYDKAVKLSNAWLAKLEVLDEVEAAIKGK